MPPIAQHDGAVAQHAHDVEIVADEQQRDIVLAPQAVEQLQHHRLHRDVERGGRLVQHQQPRPAGDGAGDADARLLAAGELVRKARQQIQRQAHTLAHLFHPLAQRIARAHAVEPHQGMGDAVEGREARVEALVRVLEDHLDVFARSGER